MIFVADCRSIWKRWSVRFHVAAVLVFSYLTAVPDAITHTWNALPDDIKGAVSPQALKWGAVGLIALGVVSTFVKQRNLSGPDGLGAESQPPVPPASS